MTNTTIRATITPGAVAVITTASTALRRPPLLAGSLTKAAAVVAPIGADNQYRRQCRQIHANAKGERMPS